MSNWLLRTLQQIREGGIQVLWRKGKRLSATLLNVIIVLLISPVGVGVILMMRALRPIVLIRVAEIDSFRIGHFVIDTTMMLVDRSMHSGHLPIWDLYYLPRKTSNAQWARMVKRQLPASWWVRYLIIYNQWVPGGAIHQTPLIDDERDIDVYLTQSDARFHFRPEETAQAKKWLQARGWKEGTPFVCLSVRDSKYLSERSENNWSYHDYRDSDIDIYLKSIEMLLAKGYWVVRMGKVMHKALSLRHPHLIDYPFVNDQDDLLDVWLSANCRFFISTGGGLDIVPNVFGQPTLYVNVVPLGYIPTYAPILWAPKPIRWKETGRYLTLREHLQNPHMRSEEYVAAGIEIHNLTDDEILAVVREMDQRIEETWCLQKMDEERHDKFWQIFKTFPNYARYYEADLSKVRISAEWLRFMDKRDFMADV